MTFAFELDTPILEHTFDLRPTPRPADVERWRASVVAEALYGLAHGTRQWERLPMKPHYDAAPPADVRMTATLPTPERLTIRVPSLPQLGIEAHRVRLYRKDYDATLAAWGWHVLMRLEALRSKAIDKHAPGTDARRATKELHALAAQTVVRDAAQPDLVLAWNAYLTSDRTPTLFTYHPQRRSVQLAPRVDPHLREAALLLAGHVELVVPHEPTRTPDD